MDGKKNEGTRRETLPPVEVYGLMLLVRMEKGPGKNPEVNCPKGAHLLYGTVTAVGDGYDPDAKTFRKLPPVGSMITFEESGENIEGHYFFVDRVEYRIVHLDSVIVCFPLSDDGSP